MKKIIASVLILSSLLFSLFAEEVQPVQKVRVHRKTASAFHLDGGALFEVPLSDDEKRAGAFCAFSLTPIQLKKLSAGCRGELAFHVTKDFIHSDNKKEEIQCDLTGVALANYPLAKSFEVYAGAGARYVVKNFKGLSDFNQAWGIVLQGGGRGRNNDWFGVGAEVNVFFNLTEEVKTLDCLAYISLEF